MRNFKRVIVEQQPTHAYNFSNCHLNIDNFDINNIELLSECLKAITQHQKTLNE